MSSNLISVAIKIKQNNMKQNITKKQWNELNKKEKNIFFVKTSDFKLDTNPYFKTPNIGQMIEFSKEKTKDNFIDNYFKNQIHIGFKNKGLQGCDSNISIGWNGEDIGDELCDVLWEQVKNKLK